MALKSKNNIQTRITIPSGLSEAARNELGLRIVTEVRARTKRGVDANGRAFKGYSKEYDKTGTVNLSQTGDMLAELDIISIGSDSILIGYDTSHELAEQVEGNTLGTFGQQTSTGKGRNFIGLPDKVVNRLATELSQDPEFEEQREESNSIFSSILNRFN